MKRRGMNDALAIRKPESISRAAATVSELDIRKWFQHIGKYLTDNNLSDILKDPRRVLNGDETSFLFDPVTKSVIASKGNQNVYLVQQAEAKKNVTVLFTFDADGYMFPPDTILPYKRLPTPVVRSFPASWGIGKSERGWMDKENFLAYIQEVLYPSLVERDVPFPVIYFVDGHSSHTGIEAAELCESLGIILVALFPNATHIMQPCDVAIFKPLKNQWTKEMDRWKMENEGLMFTIDHFAAALESAINAGIKTSTVRAGFRKCGLFPFDENSIDYSRCLQRVSENQTKLIDSSLSPVPDISTAGSSRGLDVGSPIASGTSLYLHSSSFDHQSVQTTTCVSQSQDPDITLAEHASVEQQLPGPDSCLMNIITDRTRSPNPEPTLHEQTANSTPLPHSSVGTDPSNSLQNADRRASISNFLQLPPTPKRKQVKRNYKQKRHFILTAADHIKELERKEEEKENAAIRRQEAIDLRAAKKANIEKQKQERKILLEERRALKKMEIETKKNEKEKKKMEKLKGVTKKKSKDRAKPKQIRN